jgi:alpha-L-fucosidase 2
MLALCWVVSLVLMSILGLAAKAAETDVYNDVEYGRVAGASLRLDASIPRSGKPVPAVILVHGGGWVRGDRRLNVQPLFQPLTDAGIAWFSISYRLMSDPMQFGAAIADVQAAIRFVKSHADDYHINPRRIALVGESAGGQLAAMAVLDGSSGLSVSGVAALYAPTDLVSLAGTSPLVPQQIRAALQGTPWANLILAELKRLSPIDNVQPGMPPFLLIHGTADGLVPVEQSRAMCERMRSVGAACDLYPVPGGGHGILGWESNQTLSASYKRELVRWLQQQFVAGAG